MSRHQRQCDYEVNRACVEIAWIYWRPFFAASLTMVALNWAGYTAIAPCWIWATAILLPFAAFWLILIVSVVLSAFNR